MVKFLADISLHQYAHTQPVDHSAFYRTGTGALFQGVKPTTNH